MIIGVPKETKTEEYRVGLIPAGALSSIKAGHEVIVETKAGNGSGFSDEDYQKAGAKIGNTKGAWSAEIVVKVKEPQESEFKLLRPNLILFTYLHLAAFPKLTEVLQKKRVTAIDYATVQLEDSSLPLLKPMSEISGRLAAFFGAELLRKKIGGKGMGLLLSGTPGVEPVTVLIATGGTAGTNAAQVALGMGAKVILFQHSDKKIPLQKEHFKNFGDRFDCLNLRELEKYISRADVFIGCPLDTGAKAPIIVTEEMVKGMKPGSVIIDISIDQGGCVEGSRPTTHKNPTFEKHGVIFYCVANMPGCVPRTSTIALTEKTLPYVLELGNKGFLKTVKENPALAKGVNVYQGQITYQKLAQALGKKYIPLENLL